MSTHTPGPWRLTVPTMHRFPVANVGVINVWSKVCPALDEAEANARLIAAAPRMLAALRAMTEHYVRLAASGDCGNWDPKTEAEVIEARAAIAKAEGRS